MKELIKVFKALSDPNRVRILKMLEVRSLCVCEITETLGLAASTVSKHLSLLRDAELIIDEKEGRWVYYRLNQEKETEYGHVLLPAIRLWLNDNMTVQHDRTQITNTRREDACNIYK